MSRTPKEAPLYELDRSLADESNAQQMRAILMTDATLLMAYKRSGRPPGAPKADALISEVERRGLNV
jgi:hypothetical protein